MAGPFSYTGWGTSSIAPAPTASVAPAPAPIASVKGPAGSYNTVNAPMVKPPPAPATTSVQTGGNAVAPGSFSFTGWNSSHIVPKTVSSPIVQGQAGAIPNNAIPVGQGGPASGSNVGGSGIPDAITNAQSTLDTFSNPSLLGFFNNLLNNQKGGGSGGGVATLSPTQEALNKQKLDLLGEPANLTKQLRDAEARKAAAGPTAFGMYAGSEQQRIQDTIIDLQTRLGPATQAATAAGGLAKPYTAISAPNSAGIRRNASGWAVGPWGI